MPCGPDTVPYSVVMDPRGSTIADVIRRSAARQPAAVAVEFSDRSWTYAELDAAASRVARALLGTGLVAGDRVGAYGKNSDSYLLLFLGCARAGLVHVPYNFQLAGEELEYLLSDSQASAVVADGDLAARVTQTPTGAVLAGHSFDDVLSWARDPSNDEGPEFAVAETDIAQLLYTSGTTSDPKGAIMTHRALVFHYLDCLLALDIAGDDTMVHALPLYHSAQMHVFLLPGLIQGAWNVILPGPDPETVLATIEQVGATSFFAAPTVWVAIANHPDLATRDLSRLRRAYYGASIMPGPVLARLQERLPDLGFYNAFGQSEMGPLCTVLRPDEHADHPGSAGRPVPFVEVRVVDSDGADVAPGELGEILYRSPQLFLGYWNKPEATEEAFDGGWFHSGDLVTRDADGYIAVVDRVKDVINTGGVLVASRQVEDVIYELDAVAEVAIVGVPDEKWVEAIAAFVVTKGPLAEEDVIAHVKGRLAGFKVPKRVTFVEELPPQRERQDPQEVTARRLTTPRGCWSPLRDCGRCRARGSGRRPPPATRGTSPASPVRAA